jgi:hypothetical protein
MAEDLVLCRVCAASARAEAAQHIALVDTFGEPLVL